MTSMLSVQFCEHIRTKAAGMFYYSYLQLTALIFFHIPLSWICGSSARRRWISIMRMRAAVPYAWLNGWGRWMYWASSVHMHLDTAALNTHSGGSTEYTVSDGWLNSSYRPHFMLPRRQSRVEQLKIRSRTDTHYYLRSTALNNAPCFTI